MTMSARPSSMGRIRASMLPPLYWPSPSVLTMMSAPSISARSSPDRNARPSPRLVVWRTMCVTPIDRATSMVRSRLPSSTTSTSIASTPSIRRGRSASVAGSVCSSFRQGICIISFISATGLRRLIQSQQYAATAVDSTLLILVVELAYRFRRSSEAGAANSRRASGRSVTVSASA